MGKTGTRILIVFSCLYFASGCSHLRGPSPKPVDDVLNQLRERMKKESDEQGAVDVRVIDASTATSNLGRIVGKDVGIQYADDCPIAPSDNKKGLSKPKLLITSSTGITVGGDYSGPAKQLVTLKGEVGAGSTSQFIFDGRDVRSLTRQQLEQLLNEQACRKSVFKPGETLWVVKQIQYGQLGAIFADNISADLNAKALAIGGLEVTPHDSGSVVVEDKEPRPYFAVLAPIRFLNGGPGQIVVTEDGKGGFVAATGCSRPLPSNSMVELWERGGRWGNQMTKEVESVRTPGGSIKKMDVLVSLGGTNENVTIWVPVPDDADYALVLGVVSNQHRTVEVRQGMQLQGPAVYDRTRQEWGQLRGTLNVESNQNAYQPVTMNNRIHLRHDQTNQLTFITGSPHERMPSLVDLQLFRCD